VTVGGAEGFCDSVVSVVELEGIDDTDGICDTVGIADTDCLLEVGGAELEGILDVDGLRLGELENDGSVDTSPPSSLGAVEPTMLVGDAVLEGLLDRDGC